MNHHEKLLMFFHMFQSYPHRLYMYHARIPLIHRQKQHSVQHLQQQDFLFGISYFSVLSTLNFIICSISSSASGQKSSMRSATMFFAKTGILPLEATFLTIGFPNLKPLQTLFSTYCFANPSTLSEAFFNTANVFFGTFLMASMNCL